MADDQTPNLALPYIMAAQAQKHVTHNEAIRALDALVQLMVLDKDLAAPPGAPANGDRYIVASSPSGGWAGQGSRIAAFQDGAWIFFTPRQGWVAWVADEGKLYAFDGTSWGVASASVNPTPLVGVNATADTTNRLAVSSAASLFNHAGNGHQLKLNKNAAGDTASQLFQTGFSGRAEAGLTGDDNFHIKVSADGSSWKEALVADRTTGGVSFPGNNPWSGKKWAAIGDSITAGTNGPSYVSTVATALGLSATNLAASSASVSSSSSKTGTPTVQTQAASVASDIDLVTMFVGLADFLGNATLGSIADTTAATFHGGLHAAIVAAMGASTTRTVVLMPEFIAGTSPGYTGSWNAANANGNTMAQFQQAVREVARKFGCPVIDVGAEAGIGGLTESTYLSDGVHPNAAGATRIANFIIDRLPHYNPAQPAVQVDTPVLSPAAGGYGPAQSVTITCATAGATIRYTTDGSSPTSSSTIYSGAITVAATTTVKAKAFKVGLVDSPVASATYTINGQVATPAFSVPGGSYTSAQTVTITCATSGAAIRYTTDGSTPTSSSTLYSGPVTIAATATLKAIALKSGFTDSSVLSASYTIIGSVSAPTFSPNGGTFAGTQSVTISCATAGATIYYTTDGSTPTTSSSVYSGPVSIAATGTLKAFAVKSGMTDSSVSSAAFTINGQAATPTFSPAAGAVSSGSTVSLSCATAGATIYYTTDGSTPTTSSSVYSSPITITTAVTIKAIATAALYLDSAVGSAAYTVSTVPGVSAAPYAWYAISDLATLFKDTAGTSAVTADGDLVARITDKSGHGRNITQATSGSRPIYRTSGGHKWLEYDATKALVAAAAFSLSGSGFTVAWKSRKAANDTNALVFGSTTTNTVWTGDAGTAGSNYIGLSGSGATNLNSNSLTASDLTSDHTVIITVSSGGAVTFYLNGSSVGTASGLTDLPVDQLGYHTSGSRYSGRIYEAVAFASALGSGDVAALHSYLNGL